MLTAHVNNLNDGLSKFSALAGIERLDLKSETFKIKINPSEENVNGLVLYMVVPLLFIRKCRIAWKNRKFIR
ncbi:MAG: hypothetical protein IPF72_05485 [Chitinophagaceae bacterium]|nr:hypothetical protein [Chitinophagaceae bacterium]